ncbi:hypothetical protein pb186bvf_017345 [Paramecium bursaria]
MNQKYPFKNQHKQINYYLNIDQAPFNQFIPYFNIFIIIIK